MEKKFQRNTDVGNNNSCGFYGLPCSAFRPDYGHADTGSCHHLAIVSAVSDTDAAGRAKSLDESELCRGLIFLPIEDGQLAWICAESGGRPAKGIGSNNMDDQISGQLRDNIANSGKKHPVARQRPIVVKYQVSKFKSANPWNAYLDHLSPSFLRLSGRILETILACYNSTIFTLRTGLAKARRSPIGTAQASASILDACPLPPGKLTSRMEVDRSAHRPRTALQQSEAGHDNSVDIKESVELITKP
jgi:hypothetical protein